MDYAALRFAENGYHPTSVAEIVTGMGVGKGVFYWYFSSKEELFTEILRESQLDLRKAQQAAIGHEEDAVVRITTGIRASMAWLSAHRHLYTLTEFAASDERFRPMLRRAQDIAVADLTRHVKDAIVAGQITDADPLIFSHAILGVTNQLARAFVHHRGMAPEEVADSAVAFCLGGLGGLQGAPAPGAGRGVLAAPGPGTTADGYPTDATTSVADGGTTTTGAPHRSV